MTACLTAFSSKSNATTSCSESRRMRCTMLPPILPSPTKPICVTRPPRSVGACGRPRSYSGVAACGHGVGYDHAHVVARHASEITERRAEASAARRARRPAARASSARSSACSSAAGCSARNACGCCRSRCTARGRWRLAFAVKQLNTVALPQLAGARRDGQPGHRARPLQPRHRRQRQRRDRRARENLAQRDAHGRPSAAPQGQRAGRRRRRGSSSRTA